MKSLSYLNKYFLKYKGRFAAGILFVTISNMFGIIPAKLIRYAIDEAQGQISWYRLTSDFKMSDDMIQSISFNLFVFAILVLSLALLKGIFMFFMRQTIIVASRHIEFDMKNEIYNHYQLLDQNFYSTRNTGDLMNRISEDVSRVRMYLGPAVMYSINLIVMFILVIYAMIQVNPALTFFALLPLPILSVIIYYVESIINDKSEKVQSKLSALSTFVQESFSGIRVLKSYARERNTVNDFKDLSEDYKSVSMDLVKVNALFHPSLVVLIGFSTILTIFIGGIQVMQGAITIGNIAEFVIYINMLTFPVAALGFVVSLVQRAAASQERINEFLNEKPSIVSGSIHPMKIKGKIQFNNVSFTYKNSNKVTLSDISFTIEPGKSLAITGRTGSGKTTIASLLMRFIDPDKGTIKVDDHNLKDFNLESYRSQTGFVPQEVFLFSDTIRNNIAFGIRNLIDEETLESTVKNAAEKSNILHNIEQFPLKFDTRVGERGITLSGGQKQRISIARAIVRQPAILIFDDCLSAVDTVTEEKILSNLRDIMKHKTTVIISHRISSVQNADSILVLDQGRIAEHGTHHELMNMKGMYFDLVEQQTVESELKKL